MPVNTWWYDDPAERFFMETTDRSDLGVDLHAPQADDAGHAHVAYALVPCVRHDDVVVHYQKPRGIVGWSRAVGQPFEELVVWGARGRTAHKAGVQPYLRPGWRVGLEGPFMLDEPITLQELRARQDIIRAAVEETERTVQGTIYRPFQLSTKQPLRPTQYYLTRFPLAVVRALPRLEVALEQNKKAPHHPPLTPSTSAEQLIDELGQEYVVADEEAAVSARDPFQVDPAVIDRGIRGHAQTQNALAVWARNRNLLPRSPRADEPQYDLAWLDGDSTVVAEVKSLTDSNEERQLRLGLGQVLRYRHLMEASGATVRAVLTVERRPTDTSWVALCTALGVVLCWPPDFCDLG